MKKLDPMPTLTRLISTAAIGLASPATTAAGQPEPDLGPPLRQPWLNAELIAWDKDIIKHHRLAQALGYDHVTDYRLTEYPGDSQPHPVHSRGMGFYLNDPHKKVQPNFGFTLSDVELQAALKKYPYTFGWYPTLSRAIDTAEIAEMRRQDPQIFEKVKASFERTKAWANQDRPFPQNLAQLQKWGDGTRFEPAGDYQ